MIAPALEADLRPVARALLAAAEDDAARITEEGTRVCAKLLGQARTDAAGMLSDARRQGEAEAAALVATQQSAARREGRLALLRLQRELLEELVGRSRTAAAAQRDDPAYACLHDRLAKAVRRTLGGSAVIRDGDVGGVIGEVPGRRLDLSLAVFIDQAIEELSAELFGPKPGEGSTP